MKDCANPRAFEEISRMGDARHSDDIPAPSGA
jgi:hypothetical protein